MMIALSVAILIIIAGLLALVIRLVAMPKKLDTVKKLLKQGKNQAAAKLAIRNAHFQFSFMPAAKKWQITPILLFRFRSGIFY